MRPLNFGIVGFGKHVQEHHIPLLLSADHAVLASICDIDEGKRKEAERYKVPVHVGFGDMLRHEKIDAVLGATPHFNHIALGRKAGDSGVHLIKEKPFARNYDEAVETARIANSAEILLAIHVQRRYCQTYRMAHERLGEIGSVFWGEFRYFINASPNEGWRGKRRLAGGGCLLDMGYHMVDLLLWYMGMPAWVQAVTTSQARPEQAYDAEDSAQVLCTFGNGAGATLLVSRCCPPKTESVRLLGDQGSIEVEKTSLRFRDRSGGIRRELAMDTQINHFDDFAGKVDTLARKGFVSETDHFQHMAFIEACYASAKRGHPVAPGPLLGGSP